MHSGASGFISHGSYWITEHFLNFWGSHQLDKNTCILNVYENTEGRLNSFS